MLTRLLTAKDDRRRGQTARTRDAVVPARARARTSAATRARRMPAYERAIAARAGLRRRDLRTPRPRRARSARATIRRDARPSLGHLAAITAATGALPDLRRVGRRAAPPRTRPMPAARRSSSRSPAATRPTSTRARSSRSTSRTLMRDDEPYRATLDPAERALLTDAEEATLAPIAAALAEAAALLWPDTRRGAHARRARAARRASPRPSRRPRPRCSRG